MRSTNRQTTQPFRIQQHRPTYVAETWFCSLHLQNKARIEPFFWKLNCIRRYLRSRQTSSTLSLVSIVIFFKIIFVCNLPEAPINDLFFLVTLADLIIFCLSETNPKFWNVGLQTEVNDQTNQNGPLLIVNKKSSYPLEHEFFFHNDKLSRIFSIYTVLDQSRELFLNSAEVIWATIRHAR